MAIDLNLLMNLLDPNIHLVDFEKIVMDYAALKEQMADTEKQSFYFRLALDGKKEKLNLLKERFQHIRRLFKKHTAYKLQKKIMRQEKQKLKINTPSDINLMAYMQLAAIDNQIAVYKKVLELKGRVHTMKNINYYVERPNEMLILLGFAEPEKAL